MFRRFALAAVPLAFLSPSAIAAPQDLDKVSAHLQQVGSMTAAFVQTDRKGKTLTGQLTMKRPGKVRFQYQKGVPLLIVGDGKALTVIDYQVRQVQRWPVGKSPLGVLLNPAKNIASVAKVLPSNDNRIVLVQARDPKRPEFGTLTLAFERNAAAPAGLMLQGWVSLDAQNNRTTVRLSNQRYNVVVADSAFRWTDPRRPLGRP
jgi:outer membrane lipoprotein-sorting protein